MNWELINETMDWLTTENATENEEIPFEEADFENWLEA